MANSNIHKGQIMWVESPSKIWVWIPTASGITPQGSWDYPGGNMGGSLHGSAYLDAQGTAIPCKLATPLTSGSWFTYVADKDASVFTNKKTIEDEDVVDFRIFPDWLQRFGNGMGNLQYKSDNPSASLAVCSPTLNQCGGTPIPNTGNVPPGEFPLLNEGQHVLVCFINSSSTPIIIATLPTDREIETTIG